MLRARFFARRAVIRCLAFYAQPLGPACSLCVLLQALFFAAAKEINTRTNELPVALIVSLHSEPCRGRKVLPAGPGRQVAGRCNFGPSSLERPAGPAFAR